MLSYREIIAAIKAECAKISIVYSGQSNFECADGRITSAIKEKEYLDLLEKGLKDSYPSITVSRPKERHWYDVRIQDIPINLKLTTGGTDNAFNKVAILYTISGVETTKKNMNYNQFFKAARECAKKAARDHATEYHYLVVHKERQGADSVLLKSILDIHSFKSNPCNDLQINWNNEFKHMDHCIADEDFREKTKELLKTVQTSVRQAIASMSEFAEADLDSASL